MKYRMGNQELEMNSKYLTQLKNSSDIFNDTEALRMRMEEDGYLFIRGFHDKQKVLAAQLAILSQMHDEGYLASETNINEGIIGHGNRTKTAIKDKSMAEIPAYLALIQAESIKQFFDRFLGGESLTYDFKWLRAVGNGESTPSHYDVVYMGRGTKNVYTLWTPIGDVSIDNGPLAICLGSQNFDKIKNTYGQMDVDIDKTEGGFSSDPIEIVDRFGGQWATTDFNAGDAIIFGMFMLHGSITNTSNKYRISTDIRYQLKSEPVDPRWMGKKPKGHDDIKQEEIIPIDTARKKWGI